LSSSPHDPHPLLIDVERIDTVETVLAAIRLPLLCAAEAAGLAGLLSVLAIRVVPVLRSGRRMADGRRKAIREIIAEAKRHGFTKEGSSSTSQPRCDAHGMRSESLTSSPGARKRRLWTLLDLIDLGCGSRNGSGSRRPSGRGAGVGLTLALSIRFKELMHIRRR